MISRSFASVRESLDAFHMLIENRLVRIGTRYMVVFLVLVGVLVRFINISSPLLEGHSFRQTQTAITVWTFVEEGISLCGYQTPVFGPPWRLPLEFPVFQVSAYLLTKMGITNIDVACRATNITSFCLSAFFLYLLCNLHFRTVAIPTCIMPYKKVMVNTVESLLMSYGNPGPQGQVRDKWLCLTG